MGRVKIAPTPRNRALNDAMRRAGAIVTSSSSLKVDLARPDPLPALPSKPPTIINPKSVKSSQPTTRISKETAKDRSSVESQKRKSESAEFVAPPSKKSATEKLVLRSSTNLAPTTQPDVTNRATSRDNSVRSNTSTEPVRRSTRSKVANNAATDAAAAEPAVEVTARPTRPLRSQRKASKPAVPVNPEEEERQQAISMLQGDDVYTENEDIDAMETSTLAKYSGGTQSAQGSPFTPSNEDEGPKEQVNASTLEPVSAVEAAAPVEVVADGRLPLDNKIVATREVDVFKLDSGYGLPLNPATAAPLHGDFSANITYSSSAPSSQPHVYPDPDGTLADSSYPTPPASNGAQGLPVNGYTNPSVNGFTVGHMHAYGDSQHPAPDQFPVDRSSATSGDSGYVTSYPPAQLPYFNGKSTNFPVLAPATPGSRPATFINSTKGQKVKGRPTPRNPKPRDITPRAGRNIANTYPRKQPFKAQIEFPAYPPAGSDIPADYSLWEICQNFPNSLREEVLLGFVQREWSANELCACLREDAREILNSRPGKDKTMVFQKRMERVKKDLVAKGEYQNLLNGPMVREDGRPTWVKRGNVRRK